MTVILVVDDAATDRVLAGASLSKDEQYSVVFAADGAEALDKLAADGIDLVVTDLMMPRVDGLQLVAAVRERHPLVPVILMTSLGSEEIAVRALQQGAASYVPKKRLAVDLLDTVHRVAAVSSQRKSQARLMQCMTTVHAEFELQNDAQLIGPLIGFLQENVAQLGVCDDADRVRVGVALEEALSNALYHGNLSIDSDLREQNFDAYYALAARRATESPYIERRIRVRTTLSRDEATFVVRDEGEGFDPNTLADPTDPANLEKLSGRGVLLMRTFMDEVAYNDAGNEVTMVKRRDAAKLPASL